MEIQSSNGELTHEEQVDQMEQAMLQELRGRLMITPGQWENIAQLRDQPSAETC